MSEAAQKDSSTSNIATLPARVSGHGMDVFGDPAAFDHAQRVAKVFAASTLVPKHFQGNLADCLIAYQIARRLNEEPLTAMQNVYIVNGRPGWLTSYMISRANRAGVFSSRITWSSKGEGEKLSVTASAVLADSGEVVSSTCDMAMARGEGWTKNPKYQSMPEHMLRWRSAAMLIRLFAPEVMFGMPVVEELETLPPAIKDITPAAFSGASEKLKKTLDDFVTGAASRKTASEQTAPTAAPENASAQEEGQASPAAGQGAPGDFAHQSVPGAPAAIGREDAVSTADAPLSSLQQDSAASSVAAKAPAPAQRVASKAGAGAASFKTEAEYIAHANAWLEEIEDGDAIEQRWSSEKAMRNKANVSADAREELQARVHGKVMKLRGQT